MVKVSPAQPAVLLHWQSEGNFAYNRPIRPIYGPVAGYLLIASRSINLGYVHLTLLLRRFSRNVYLDECTSVVLPNQRDSKDINNLDN